MLFERMSVLFVPLANIKRNWPFQQWRHLSTESLLPSPLLHSLLFSSSFPFKSLPCQVAKLHQHLHHKDKKLLQRKTKSKEEKGAFPIATSFFFFSSNLILSTLSLLYSYLSILSTICVFSFFFLCNCCCLQNAFRLWNWLK